MIVDVCVCVSDMQLDIFCMRADVSYTRAEHSLLILASHVDSAQNSSQIFEK